MKKSLSVRRMSTKSIKYKVNRTKDDSSSETSRPLEMNFREIALSLISLPRLGGIPAGVLETGNSTGKSESSIYRASGDRFRYPARDYSEQSEGTPGGTLKVSASPIG
jgi:hypothetical protein